MKTLTTIFLFGLLSFSGNSQNAAMFSTFFGGKYLDEAKICTQDSKGNVYVAGSVSEEMYISKNATDSSYNDGYYDIGITKFSPNGDSILFATYLGGSDWEEVYGMEIDLNGNILISGRTASSDFPTTQGVYNDSFTIGMHAFVAKINPFSGKLIFSTFIGEGNAHSLRILSNENIVVGGLTESNIFPLTNGAFDTSANGDLDVFVSILSKNGDSLLYSTLVGSEKWDRFASLDIDNNDFIYIAGFSEGDSFPKPTNANLSSGIGYVVKLSPKLDKLIYCTRLETIVWDIAVDRKLGKAFVLGAESDSKYKFPNGVYKSDAIGRLDVMIFKLNSLGSKVENGTFFGGYSTDFPLAIDIDAQERVYIAGRASGTIPTTKLALSRAHHSVLPGIDAFVAVLSADFKDLIYSSLLGKWDFEAAWDIHTSPTGEFVVVGETSSEHFQVTQNAYQKNLNGASDFFITKFDIRKVSTIDQIERDVKLNVFPNPASSQINIQFNNKMKRIVLINNLGERVKTFDLNSEEAALPILDISSGIYILEIQSQSGLIKRKRIIISH